MLEPPPAIWYDSAGLDPQWPAPSPIRRNRTPLIVLTALVALTLIVVAVVLGKPFARATGLYTRVSAGTPVRLGPYRVVPQRAEWSLSDTSSRLAVIATCQLVDDARTIYVDNQVPSGVIASWAPTSSSPLLTRPQLKFDTLGEVDLAPREALSPGVPASGCTITFQLDRPLDQPPAMVLVQVDPMMFRTSTGATSSDRWVLTGRPMVMELPAAVVG